MSGVSVSTNTSSANEEQRRKERLENTTSILKAGAGLVAGAVTVSATVAGLAVYGAFRAVTAVGRAGIKAYRSHKEKEAVRQLEMQKLYRRGIETLKRRETNVSHIQEYKSMLSDEVTSMFGTAQPENISAEVNTAMQKIDRLEALLENKNDSIENNMIAELRNIKCSAESGMTAEINRFTADTSGKVSSIINKWNEASQDIVVRYAEKQKENIDTLRNEMNRRYSKMKSEISSMGSNLDLKKNRTKQLAETAVSDAEAVVRRLIGIHGAVYRSCDIKLLMDSLRSAQNMLKSSDYAMAFSRAEDISLNALEILSDVLNEEARRKAELSSLTVKLATVGEQIAVDEVVFIHKKTEYRDNLRRFAKHGFSSADRILECLWAKVHDDMSLDEINEVKRDAEKLQRNFRSVYNLAWNRMISSYHTSDTATALRKAFEEQGLKMVGHAFEGTTEGEPIHINFTNARNEKVTLIVNCDENGIPDIELHHFGNGVSSEPDSALENTLNRIITSTTGVGMQCTSPGQFSHNKETADLDRVKEKAVM